MQKKIRIAYDITRLSQAGGNGGVKPLLYEFLKRICQFRSESFHLIVLAKSEIVGELSFLATLPNVEIYLSGDDTQVDPRSHKSPIPVIHYWTVAPESLLESLRADLLYAGFGFSDFHNSKIPQISLLVDCLHNDLPYHLPESEVAYRSDWYPKAIAQSSLIHTISDFCSIRIQFHYKVPQDKILRTYLPLHSRFDTIDQARLPDQLVDRPYFLYPANYWSHKNHEGLLLGYRQYLKATPDYKQWDLVLTGHIDERGQAIQELTKTLGIDKHIHFFQHLDDSSFKSIWEYADALVFPSLYEGFGLPIVEALHFQTPIACSNVASLPEITRDAALLFDPRKPSEIAHALTTLAENPTIRKDLVEKGRSILPEYQLDPEAEKLVLAIESLTPLSQY